MTMQLGLYKIVQVVEQRERQARAEQYRQARLARATSGRGLTRRATGPIS
ncbi:MAG TPA: hypothetical protein VIL37_11630 [Natronosporangium sp.]